MIQANLVYDLRDLEDKLANAKWNKKILQKKLIHVSANLNNALNGIKCGLASHAFVKQSFIIEKPEPWENAVERCIKWLISHAHILRSIHTEEFWSSIWNKLLQSRRKVLNFLVLLWAEFHLKINGIVWCLCLHSNYCNTHFSQVYQNQSNPPWSLPDTGNHYT